MGPTYYSLQVAISPCSPCRSNLLESNHVPISAAKLWCPPPAFCPCRSNLLESNHVPISAAKVWCPPPTCCPCRYNLLESNHVPISAAKALVSTPLTYIIKETEGY